MTVLTAKSLYNTVYTYSYYLQFVLISGIHWSKVKSHRCQKGFVDLCGGKTFPLGAVVVRWGWTEPFVQGGGLSNSLLNGRVWVFGKMMDDCMSSESSGCCLVI